MCFLNARGDLIVGHKGKLSRIWAKDYLPDKSLYEVPEPAEYHRELEKFSAPIPDNFFTLIKNQNDEVVA